MNHLLAVMATGALSASFSFGALAFYDGFDGYTTGTDLASGVTGWSVRNGSGTATVVDATQDLEYGSLQTTPGAMVLNVVAAGWLNLDRDTGTGGGDHWISFLMKSPAAELAVMRTGPADGWPTIGNLNTNGYGTWGGGGTLVGAGVPFVAGETVFIAAQVSGGTVTWWLNPTPGAVDPGTAYETMSGGMDNLLEFAMVPSTNGLIFDEIRVGDTWADVSPIPEPATIGLVALFGGAALFGRRRRR